MIGFLPQTMPSSQYTYTKMQIYGWTVNVGSDEIHDPTWPAMELEIKNQLFRISRVVGDAPLAKLRTIQIWVHRDDKATICAAYHPGAQWLIDRGFDARMAGGLELANAQNFLSWTHEQPWMVLHELAHGYNAHFMPGGMDNKQIEDVYQEDMDAHLYDSVLHYNGEKVKAYATTNAHEYFAECTEAFFGRNDFYPFVNAELKTYDPKGYQLMESVWGQPVHRLTPDK